MFFRTEWAAITLAAISGNRLGVGFTFGFKSCIRIAGEFVVRLLLAGQLLALPISEVCSVGWGGLWKVDPVNA